jgi:hypothetical protein
MTWIVHLLVLCAATGGRAEPLWARGSYAKLSFASDLSSRLTFGSIVLHAGPPIANVSSTQSNGTDVNMGCFDALTMGPYVVRYFKKLDSFTFERTYPLPIVPRNPTASTSSAGSACVDLSGVYNTPGTKVGTGPGGVNVVSTVSQHGCSITVGGESLCNGANATVLPNAKVNGTGGCLKGKTGTWNGTHIQFGGDFVWTRLDPGFPSFEVSDAATASALGCLGWEDVAFAPGKRSISLVNCQTDGPVLAFHNSTRATFVFSALDHFTTNIPAPSATGITVATQGAAIPAGTTMATLLLARPTPNRAMRAWGSAMRQKYNTTRNRGAATLGE